MTTSALIAAVAVLAAGTFAFRLAGVELQSRMSLSPKVEQLLGVSVVVLFSALVATSALMDDQEFAGFAQPAGVAVAGVLAWRKAPFVVVVLAAAATTAGLRFLNVR